MVEIKMGMDSHSSSISLFPIWGIAKVTGEETKANPKEIST